MTAKEDCLNYLTYRAERAADWREFQACKYPADSRNTLAAQRLNTLAAGMTIPPDVWSDLERHYDESSPRWLDAVSQTNREVCFRKHPLDTAAYLRNLISNLTN